MAYKERNFFLLSLILSTLAGLFLGADAAQITFGTCTPPQSEERGQCVHITDCPFLANLLASGTKDPAQRTLLSKSQCGLDNRVEGLMNRILVCCPHSEQKDKEEPRTTEVEGQQPGNLLPGSDVCGFLFADRIFGGTNTSLWEYPWMVLLRYKKLFPESYMFGCGGALLNSRYVLTAGHCVSSRDLEKSGATLNSVRLGEWDTRTDPDCAVQMNGKRICAPNHIDIEVEKHIIHEQYTPNSVDQRNDIALLRLKQSVTYTDYVRPICLPTGDLVRNNFVGYGMDVAGWGLTENLVNSPTKLKLTVNVWNLTSCQEKYSTFKVKLDDTQICAGGLFGYDTCGGDSGGPLMVGNTSGGREVFYIAGVTSYGTKPCGLKGWPGVYTRTGAFIEWIQQKLEA
ncbi:spaetzle-processing enzyme [Drosophila ficusphila]|uniref:spaetzle-processing enzyme n=1 Tax=Drosophila ficusphila TaxID=30025 RepID=UPI0007E62454|nr:spaetzle-processing enzyme [Drosophila ficusphila]